MSVQSPVLYTDQVSFIVYSLIVDNHDPTLTTSALLERASSTIPRIAVALWLRVGAGQLGHQPIHALTELAMLIDIRRGFIATLVSRIRSTTITSGSIGKTTP
jgi:hypothetical protein